MVANEHEHESAECVFEIVYDICGWILHVLSNWIVEKMCTVYFVHLPIRKAKQEQAIQFGILSQMEDRKDVFTRNGKGERCFSRKLFPFYVDKLLSPTNKKINEVLPIRKKTHAQLGRKNFIHQCMVFILSFFRSKSSLFASIKLL